MASIGMKRAPLSDDLRLSLVDDLELSDRDVRQHAA